jgi:nucleotide-binding universal stress UspA family protein
MVAKNYLVPVDFSKSSLAALNYAARLAKENGKGALTLVHVITDSTAPVPFYMRENFLEALDREARQKLDKLIKKKNLRSLKCRVIIVQASDAAKAAADEAKKRRVSMIVMGTEGRTGVNRFVSGSVAEKTVRYAPCPVLIVKS